MGFLLGKTAVITGGGRAVLSDGGCGSIGYGIAVAYAKRVQTLLLQAEMSKSLRMPKKSSKDFTE